MGFKVKIEDIKYVKICYKTLSSTFCNAKIGIKSMNEKEIIACGKFENSLDIDTPQQINMSIVCNDGLYKTKTNLLSFTNEVPYTFFKIETPQSIEYEQNREYFRVPADFDCIYKIPETSKEYRAKTVDLSANGISITLPTHEISENNVEIYLLINNKKIEIQARYVRSERIKDGYKISFAYQKISESDRDFISQICIQKQLQERRRHLK